MVTTRFEMNALPSLKASLPHHVRAMELTARCSIQHASGTSGDVKAIWGEIGPLAGTLITAENCEFVQEGSRLETGLFLKMPLKGEVTATQGSQAISLRPGDFALLRSDRPQRVSFAQGTELLVFCIPTNVLDPMLDLAAMEGLAVSSHHPQAQLVTDYLKSLWKQCALRDSDAISTNAIRALGDLVSLCLPSTARPTSHGQGQIGWASIERYLERHRFDPALSVAGMAAELGVSSRRLQQMFAHRGLQPIRHIINMRLEAAQKRIEQNVAGESITQIAYED